MLVANDVVTLYRLLMSCDVASVTSIKMLILCLLTSAEYLVMLSIDITCTKVSCYDEWVMINWFIWVLMLFMSFVVQLL